MRYLLILTILLCSSTAQALNCTEEPSCESLGYSKTSDPKCQTDGYVYCPFDKSYKKCLNKPTECPECETCECPECTASEKPDCATLGFTLSDKMLWCQKLAKCPYDESYTLCRGLCEIGDVFYSDGSCGDVSEYDANDERKIPVGVIYWLKDDGKHGKVISLQDISVDAGYDFQASNPYKNTYKEMPWGLYGTEIASITANGNENLRDRSIAKLFNGKDNTETIRKTKSTYLYCTHNINNEYSEGTVNYNIYCGPTVARAAILFDPGYPKGLWSGMWYLPALGELMDLYGYKNNNFTWRDAAKNATGTIKEKVNATLKALKSKGVEAKEFTATTGLCYWSSTAYNENIAWCLDMSKGILSMASGKNTNRSVRLSLEF